jgi:hypothetical protein
MPVNYRLFAYSLWSPRSCFKRLAAHACNPSYSRGRDQEDGSSNQPRQIVHETLSPKTLHKNRPDGVAQVEGPEFKPQYHTHTHTHKNPTKNTKHSGNYISACVECCVWHKKTMSIKTVNGPNPSWKYHPDVSHHSNLKLINCLLHKDWEPWAISSEPAACLQCSSLPSLFSCFCCQ